MEEGDDVGEGLNTGVILLKVTILSFAGNNALLYTDYKIPIHSEFTLNMGAVESVLR